jgi:hypothetical protein
MSMIGPWGIRRYAKPVWAGEGRPGIPASALLRREAFFRMNDPRIWFGDAGVTVDGFVVNVGWPGRFTAASESWGALLDTGEKKDL